MAAKRLNSNMIKESESAGFVNRSAGMSENGIATVATEPVTSTNQHALSDNIEQEGVQPKPKAKRGRPKKEEKDKRDNVVTLYLTDDLHKKLSIAASDADMSINQYVIMALKSYKV